MRIIAVALMFVLGLFGQGALAGSCDPDFGDKALSWVQNDVYRQSRDLTKADYEARALSFRIVGYERLHKKLNAIVQELDGISAEIDQLDRSGRPEVALAIERELTARRNLARLYAASASLEDTEIYLAPLITKATREAFNTEGYRAVGRETLVASLREIGAATEATLNGRYGVYVEVNFGENGKPTDGSAKPSVPGGEFVSVGISLISTGEPYAVVGGAILVVIGGVIAYRCIDNWKTQERRLREASDLLESKLISADEQWALFERAEQNAVVRFTKHGDEVKALTEAVRKRWTNLFAANAARAAAAGAVLSAARVAQIQRDMRNRLDPGAILEQVAITTIASDVGSVNAAIARGRIKVLTACTNTQGLLDEEDQVDSIAFARAQLRVLRRQASFIPLYSMLDGSLNSLSVADQELRNRGPTAARRSCDSTRPMQAPQKYELFDSVDLFSSLAKTANSAVASPAKSSVVEKATVRAVRTSGPSSCVLVSNGQFYACRSGRGGQTYGSQFDSRHGDPNRDVRQGAGDGGFAQDSRTLSGNVDAARSNIDHRIAEVQRRSQAAAAALPEWTQTNNAAMQAATSATQEQASIEAASSQRFQQNEAALLARVKDELARFTASPTDPNNIRNLVGAAGAANLRLPDLPADALVPTVPEIIGFEARRANFGSDVSSAVVATIRERLKADRELVPHPSSRSLSNDLTRYSERLARDGAFGAQSLSNQLVLDSAALRFAAAGKIPQAEFAFVEKDGSIVRRPVSNLDELPPNTLISITRRFYRDDTYFRVSMGQLRSELNAGAPFAGRRVEVANVAEGLAVRARDALRAGDPLSAGTLMTMAIGVLDVATRFLPVVSWGRDVYEAVSGRDLITGEELSTFDRVTAVIGVVTAGLGDDGLKIFQVLKRIDGVPTKKVDDLYEFGKTVDADTLSDLRYSDHAIERIDERLITEGEIRKVLDNHSPYVYMGKVEYEVRGVPVREARHPYNAVGRVNDSEHLIVSVDIERRTVVTVIRVPDADLRGTLSSTMESGRRRYKELDLRD